MENEIQQDKCETKTGDIILNQYKVLKQLGKGGMDSVIYLVEDITEEKTPTISFNNGKVSFTCETEGAEFVSEVKAGDAKLYYDSEYTLSQKYTISVYATKTGYDNSDTVTRDIIITGDGKAIIVGDVDGDGKVNVADHVELSKIILNQ